MGALCAIALYLREMKGFRKQMIGGYYDGKPILAAWFCFERSQYGGNILGNLIEHNHGISFHTSIHFYLNISS